MLEELIRQGHVWISENEEGTGIEFEVNCNDLFSWASCDSETIPFDEIESCYLLGPSAWVCIRRNMRPQYPVMVMMKAKNEWTPELEALPERDA